MSSLFEKIKKDFTANLDTPARLLAEYHVGMTYAEIAAEPGVQENTDRRMLNRLYRDGVQFLDMEFRQGFAFDAEEKLAGVILICPFTKDAFFHLITGLDRQHVLFHIETAMHFYELEELYERFPGKRQEAVIKQGLSQGLQEQNLKVGYIDKDVPGYMRRNGIDWHKSINMVRAMRPSHRLIDVIVGRDAPLLVKFVHPRGLAPFRAPRILRETGPHGPDVPRTRGDDGAAWPR